jgi:hypothetical protein
MHTTISQILYPNRQAFFDRLALSLPLQPAIKIGPVTSFKRSAQTRIAPSAKGGPDTDIVHGRTKHAGKAKTFDNAATGDVLAQ